MLISRFNRYYRAVYMCAIENSSIGEDEKKKRAINNLGMDETDGVCGKEVGGGRFALNYKQCNN